MLLHHISGATSFKDMRTINGIEYSTYKEAAEQLGLVENDEEWKSCLEEASTIKTGSHLRHLFVTILVFCTSANPGKLFKKHFCDDIRAANTALIMIE